MPGSRSSYSFESIVMDLSDCIGIESGGADLITDVDLGGVRKSNDQDGGNSGGRSARCSDELRPDKMEKEFPPPIPWLARTENLPCFMKRYYTDDGRLVIVEEKVQRLDFFQTDRSNGRLTLRLIPIAARDDDDAGVGNNHIDSVVLGRDGKEGDDHTVVGEESMMTTNLGNGVDVMGNGGGGGAVGGVGGGKFYHHYCNLSRNSCMFGGGCGEAVAAVRSVHT